MKLLENNQIVSILDQIHQYVKYIKVQDSWFYEYLSPDGIIYKGPFTNYKDCKLYSIAWFLDNLSEVAYTQWIDRS